MSAPVSHHQKSDTARRNRRRKPEGGPVVLNARMLRMIWLMVRGHPDDPSRTPYGIYEAAAAVGYRRRAARELAISPAFFEAYQRELAGRGNAGVIPTLEQVRREMQLRQGDRQRGAGPPKAPPPAAITPGYVIRPRAPKPDAEAGE